MADDSAANELLAPTYTLPPGFQAWTGWNPFHLTVHDVTGRQVHATTDGGATLSPAQPPTNGGGTPGAGTGSDPLSTLASAYMASLSGGGGASQQPVVILPAPATESAGVNWGMIGALAALALVGWAVWTWWKGRHKT